MTARQFVYRLLTTTPAITDLVGGSGNPRVFAKKSMTSSIEAHPYIVYKLGYSTDRGILAEDAETVENQFIQIWVHDYADVTSGDYTKIDLIISAIKATFKNAASLEDGVSGTTYLETSQDLNDDTLNTVFKYVRIQFNKRE